MISEKDIADIISKAPFEGIQIDVSIVNKRLIARFYPRCLNGHFASEFGFPSDHSTDPAAVALGFLSMFAGLNPDCEVEFFDLDAGGRRISSMEVKAAVERDDGPALSPAPASAGGLSGVELALNGTTASSIELCGKRRS